MVFKNGSLISPEGSERRGEKKRKKVIKYKKGRR